MEDITARLRTSADPDAVDRERSMASALFRSAVSEVDFGTRQLSSEQLHKLAKQSIEAACVFWEEWDIAVLTPDVTPNRQGAA